ncbi:potassium transporter TrkG [uncultured Algimonas sp.]|uniref:TrkH family potassium uptake protein n=1 Tax=uncultured Algimonas sp. TaxID=1547920 RepID=UPI002624008C|nr:potassium transporter TrkG [uncultured Algimonas sp.]
MREWLDGLPTPLKIAVAYLAFVAFGTFLLWLPVSSHAGLSVSEAAFTATSAVTVTGLSVIDVGAELTFAGEFVLLLLIQFGGVGLITLTVFVLSALGMTVGVERLTLMHSEIGAGKRTRILKLITRIVKIVMVGQALCAAILAWLWIPEMGWRDGLWMAVFHAVSAFNHAGFDLFGNSLKDFATDPFVLLTVSITFVLSSLGFIVYADLRHGWRWARLNLHTRLMLVGTAVLIVVPVALFILLERDNPQTLGQTASGLEMFGLAFFQSVTPRTAGFAAVDTASLEDATTWMTMILMTIGGGTGSTAGGIKVTTIIVLLLAAVAYFRQTRHIRIFRTSVDRRQVHKAMTLGIIAGLVMCVTTFVLLATQTTDMIDTMFEATSALGTVGLSRGITGDLDQTGRTTVMILMFLGRLGPLTLGYLIASQRPPLTRYPNGEIHLG